jgi:hypothetical protein
MFVSPAFRPSRKVSAVRRGLLLRIGHKQTRLRRRRLQLPIRSDERELLGAHAEVVLQHQRGSQI